jgi:hypothetical protein
MPCLELRAPLSEIFTISHCEAVSGLTCRIRYNGKRPLPSEVFFYGLDAKGKTACRPIRLIYPRLKPGEVGSATFFLNACSDSSERVVLEGKWNGPYKNPY